jgi:hypothetical protein
MTLILAAQFPVASFARLRINLNSAVETHAKDTKGAKAEGMLNFCRRNGFTCRVKQGMRSFPNLFASLAPLA